MSGAPPIGVVLAGGAGSRIGGSKAAVVLGGRPLISYPLAALRESGLRRLAVVAKEDSELPALGADVEVWREPAEPRHPLAGVAEALRRADGRAVVVLACDMPHVDAALVRALVAADAGGAPAVVAVTETGGLQPLFARYEPAALPALADFDPSGRAVAQVAALRPATLNVAEDALRNVNTPDDLARAEPTAGT